MAALDRLEPLELAKYCFIATICWRLLYEICLVLSPVVIPKSWETIAKSKTKGGEKQRYFCSLVVSSTHASVVALYAFYLAYTTPILTLQTFNDTMEETVIIGVLMVGYLTHDSIVINQYKKHWDGVLLMTCHHGAAIFALSWLMYYQYGHAMIVVTAILECTTPFINLRWILDVLDLKSNPIYLLNGGLFALMWLIFRLIFFGWAGYKYVWVTLRHDLTTNYPYSHFLVVQTGWLFGYYLQVHWAYFIFKGLAKALGISGGGDKKKK